MADLILLPNKLNPNTSLADNIALLNDNFDSVLQDANTLQPTYTYPPQIARYDRLVVAGGTLNLVVVVFGDSPTANIVAMLPEFSIYVDNFDPLYIFPDGTSLSSGQKALRYGAVNQLTGSFGSAGAPGAPGITIGTPFNIGGKTLYVIGGIVLTINNGDVADHIYTTIIDVKSFALPTQSVFR